MSARFVHHYLGYLLGQANHALFKGFAAQAQAAGLSHAQWRVLAALDRGPALTISALAQEVLSQQPTLTKLVQRLARQGLVSLARDAQDQRRTLVTITPTGAALVRPLIAQARRHESRLLRALPAPERVLLKQNLQRLITVAQND